MKEKTAIGDNLGFQLLTVGELKAKGIEEFIASIAGEGLGVTFSDIYKQGVDDTLAEMAEYAENLRKGAT